MITVICVCQSLHSLRRRPIHYSTDNFGIMQSCGEQKTPTGSQRTDNWIWRRNLFFFPLNRNYAHLANYALSKLMGFSACIEPSLSIAQGFSSVVLVWLTHTYKQLDLLRVAVYRHVFNLLPAVTGELEATEERAGIERNKHLLMLFLP